LASLPKSVECPAESGAGVGDAAAEHLGELGVRELGVELEEDQLALGGVEAVEGSPDRLIAQALVLVLEGRLVVDGNIAQEGGRPPAPAELVEGGVPGDPEQPGPGAPATRVEDHPAAVGPLEGDRGDVLGGGAVAKERPDIGVDVGQARPVELLEPTWVGGRQRRRRRCGRTDHRPAAGWQCALTTRLRRRWLSITTKARPWPL